MSRFWPLFAKSTPDLKVRRSKALETAAWGVGRGALNGAVPGFVLQMPVYVASDLWMFKSIYECYFDKSPTEMQLKELLTKYLAAAGMATMSISAARALASYIAALPSPVTTPVGAAIGGGAAFGTAARIMFVCEALYKQENF